MADVNLDLIAPKGIVGNTEINGEVINYDTYFANLTDVVNGLRQDYFGRLAFTRGMQAHEEREAKLQQAMGAISNVNNLDAILAEALRLKEEENNEGNTPRETHQDEGNGNDQGGNQEGD